MAEPCVAAELAQFGPRAPSAGRPTLADARRYCGRFARSHYENFTVASWLLPRRLRPHFHAVYAYCRWADDLADETDRGESLPLLDWWQGELDLCYAGRASHPVFVALSATIEEFSIPREPFARLLDAFRQDQRVTRYATHEEVLAYCRNSANPVGRLILYITGTHDERRGELSDSICTGLQLANFCQDVARDWAKDRVYLPAETLARAGCELSTFARGTCEAAFRRALAHEVDRAEGYLRRGAPLVERVGAELRVEIELFVGGGMAILEAIRGADYDVWSRRPTVSRRRKLGLLAGAWLRSAAARVKWHGGPNHEH